MKGYVKRQYEVLQFVTSYIASFGISPTYKEICIGCKIRSKSHAYKIIDHLITIGQLEKFGKRNCNRTIILPKRKNSHNESSNKQNKVLRGIYIYD